MTKQTKAGEVKTIKTWVIYNPENIVLRGATARKPYLYKTQADAKNDCYEEEEVAVSATITYTVPERTIPTRTHEELEAELGYKFEYKK